jgi:prevent-host-death family protein
MMVVKVGVRELRENLRSWLERVKNGDQIVITDRGEPVARIEALGVESRLEELIRLGVVRPPLSKKRHVIDVSKLPTLTPGPTLSDIVIEQRRSARY